MAKRMGCGRQVAGWGFALAALVTVCSTVLADDTDVLQQLEQAQTRYATAQAWAARRQELRTEFLKGAGLWPLPPRPPVVAVVHSRREYGDYSVENAVLETFPGFYCTGNLYRPIGRKDLSPVVLCPHGHLPPLGRFRAEQQIGCAHLARMGATVFSYSMVGWQDSRQTAHDDPRVLALQTWNSIRVLDYLIGLARIDPQRVGISGVSGGGTQTLYLTLVDDRVKVSAPVAIVDPAVAPEGCLCAGVLALMHPARTNAIEFAAAAAPRPQLFVSVGEHDPARDLPTVGLPFLRHVYGLTGAAEKLVASHLADEGHDLGPAMRRLVYEFFAAHLPLEPNRFLAVDKTSANPLFVEDLTKIRIETPKQMEAFSAAHPLPPHALSGSEAVGAAFEKYLHDLRQASAPRAGSDAADCGQPRSQAPLGNQSVAEPKCAAPSRAGIVRIDRAPLAGYAFKESGAEDEALLFTPAGFEKVGLPKVASGADTGLIDITVRDAAGGQPTPCRINVVGPDGDYYEPSGGLLKQHSFTGIWPQSGWGNRQGKAPIRYLGRFFYSDGTDAVTVPAGVVRVEVWKGFESRPAAVTTQVAAGGTRRIDVVLERTAPMLPHHYWSGDPHIHIERHDERDEQRILGLLAAEDIRFGATLAYNDPAGRYVGRLESLDAPQLRGLGKRSAVQRDGCAILSAQEYRSGHYGHLNLYLLDELVACGRSYNADHWPPFGRVAAEARQAGGVAVHAHGGYAQEIYADVVHGDVDAVELLQFGVYRGIGLEDWYHMLNAGFRVPACGACDYPACRKLGDCLTYVCSEQPPDMEGWLRGMARGESFFTSGPLLLLEVDGARPGSQIDRSGAGPHLVTARVRVRSEVAPVTHVQVIARGRVLRQLEVPRSAGQGAWLELEQTIELDQSAWIAARAYSLSPLGTPDAESHTNPVYVYINGRAPYEQSSLDRLAAAIDKQIAIHQKREFAERGKVLAYFEQARDILRRIRDSGGITVGRRP